MSKNCYSTSHQACNLSSSSPELHIQQSWQQTWSLSFAQSVRWVDTAGVTFQWSLCAHGPLSPRQFPPAMACSLLVKLPPRGACHHLPTCLVWRRRTKATTPTSRSFPKTAQDGQANRNQQTQRGKVGMFVRILFYFFTFYLKFLYNWTLTILHIHGTNKYTWNSESIKNTSREK